MKEIEVKRSRLNDKALYFVKAFILVGLLLFVAKLSPVFPPFVFPFILLIYAIPATIGSMFNVVSNRLHRQDLYNETGKLSHYNRRWTIWISGFFFVYLISGLMFVLQAPSWDFAEWIIMWLAILGYFGIFLVIQRICKSEFAKKYYKARAIKWSIIVSAIVLALVYAIVSAQPPTDMQIDLHDIINDRYMPFEFSPCALLSEIDKLTTYANCLTEYGAKQLSNGSYLIAVVIKFAISLSAFIGVVSQFGSCLLNSQEIKGEFQLLPTNDEEEYAIRKRYLAILAAIWLLVSVAFLLANGAMERVRATSEYTQVDQWVDDTSDKIIAIAEVGMDKLIENNEIVEEVREYSDARDEYVSENSGELIDAINSYYDECISNIDSYMQWYDGVFGQAARLVPFIGEGAAKDEFQKRVIDQANSGAINAIYSDYVSGLEALYEEYRSLDQNGKIADLPEKPELWISWDDIKPKGLAQEVLLGAGKSTDSESERERLREFINDRRSRVLDFIGKLPSEFFSISIL